VPALVLSAIEAGEIQTSAEAMWNVREAERRSNEQRARYLAARLGLRVSKRRRGGYQLARIEKNTITIVLGKRFDATLAELLDYVERHAERLEPRLKPLSMASVVRTEKRVAAITKSAIERGVVVPRRLAAEITEHANTRKARS